MIVSDVYLNRKQVIERLRNGAAFSLFWIDDGWSRTGFSVKGFAIDPISFTSLRDSDENEGTFYFHHFSGANTTPDIFTQSMGIHQFLGMVTYIASTKGKMTWRHGDSESGATNFRRFICAPSVTSKHLGTTGTYSNTRNNSLFPVFRTDERNRDETVSMTRVGFQQPGFTDDANLLRGSKTTNLNDFRSFLTKPNGRRIPAEQIFEHLKQSITFKPQNINRRPEIFNIGDRHAGNGSSLFTYEINAGISSAPALYTSRANRTPFDISEDRAWPDPIIKVNAPDPIPEEPQVNLNRYQRKRSI